MSRYSSTTKTSLLKDNSWIRKADEEDEDVDRDPNFGRSVLSQYRSTENLGGADTEEITTTKTIRTSTSVQALTKRFSGSQDELRSSTLPSSKTTSTYTKSSYSSLKSDSPKITTTTTVTERGGTESPTTTLRSPVTTTFTERVKSSSKGAQYTTYSPTRTTKVTETIVTSDKDAEDKLYDTLIPSSIKNDYSPTDSKTTVSSSETVTVKSSPDGERTYSTTEIVTVKSSPDIDAEDKLYDTLIPSSIKNDYTDSKTTVSSSETVTVKSSPDADGFKITTTTTTSSTPVDDLYDTLLPKSITSPTRDESPTYSSTSTTRRSYSSYTDDVPSVRTTTRTISTKPSEDYSSDRKYSYTRSDSSSITSPSTYTTAYRSSSSSDDILSDTSYSRSSIKSLYASPERTVLEKDLCTYCRKPFTGDAKMILDDMKINCHAHCFKCEVCDGTLGHMKAGDSMWIYKRMVHCENCFEVTREKWRR
ncbi:sciellin isoform X5 [Larimichthys crocea]|uniref:sciellin isoform X4 n=1 Tax=Larimichthys crocea TaxID=215358 RepID=UPI000F5E2488|nr:sciellin isoform X4 [Larimichthys crocea]XP_027146566.1 sciellin isoform X5 [Larimichthys crocea]